MTRQEVFHRIWGVEAEHRAAALAISRLRLQSAEDPALLHPANLGTRDLVECARNLDGTYVIRIYAGFEAALRDFWKSPHGMRRRTEPPAETLINSVAVRR